MVISQWNSFLQDAVGKGQKHQPWNKDATSRLRGLPQTRLATGLRGAIGAALMGKIFEDGLGMYSQVPDPIGALVDGLADDEDAALIVFEIGRELLELPPIISAAKFEDSSVAGLATANVINNVGFVRAFSAAYRENYEWYDPVEAAVKSLHETFMRGDVGDAPLALTGLPFLRQTLKTLRAHYRGSDDDWWTMLKGYDFEEVEDRRR